MWQIKQFKTQEAMDKFIDKNRHKIQWQEIFINNAYGIEYRKLKRIH
jgi:hypothetical protein